MSHSRKWKKRRKALREAQVRKLAEIVGEAKPKDHQMSLHHRKCKANGGATNARNTIMLPIKVRQAWHTITQSHSPEWIAEFINDNLLDPEYEFVCIRRE